MIKTVNILEINIEHTRIVYLFNVSFLSLIFLHKTKFKNFWPNQQFTSLSYKTNHTSVLSQTQAVVYLDYVGETQGEQVDGKPQYVEVGDSNKRHLRCQVVIL